MAYDKRSSRCHGARGPEKPTNLRRVSPQAAYDETPSCCHGVRRAKNHQNGSGFRDEAAHDRMTRHPPGPAAGSQRWGQSVFSVDFACFCFLYRWDRSRLLEQSRASKRRVGTWIAAGRPVAYDRTSSRCHGAHAPEKPTTLRGISPKWPDRTPSSCHGVRRARKPMKMIANSAPRWPMTWDISRPM